nr:papain-like cysteine protease family protein [uncultured Pseudomonas sp.]
MRRRTFLLSSCWAALTTLPVISDAKLACGPYVPPGIQKCNAGIDSSLADIAAAAVGGQHLSQWCWAACIEMVFTYYGHPVPQERIVYETWGSIVNLPGQPPQIVKSLNRYWTDNDGASFLAIADTTSVNEITAAHDLASDMPLIIGTMGHAVVLTALTYVHDTFGGGQVQIATVRDPWPGRGRRTLTNQEWNNISFAARIRVQQ